MIKAMKLRAISKAMRGEKGNDTRPGRKYMVSKQGGATKGDKLYISTRQRRHLSRLANKKAVGRSKESSKREEGKGVECIHVWRIGFGE
mmetsp:Transcript_31864/g.32112  ORF Transcript_31864/g.32112 Transcript_31864/m.32112 type:complete len:89 (+) Transcript_31864:159-425(+)